jgi:membrane-associated phospholipid phosphatase
MADAQKATQAAQAAAADAKQAAAEVGKGRPGVHARHWLWQIALASALLFGVDSYYVLSGSYTIVDRAVELFVQGFPWGPVVYAFAAFNAVAGLWQLIAGLALAVLMAAWDRRAGWLMFIGAGASLLDNLVKVLVARQRPAADLVHVLNPATGYSFPSGHAVFYTWVAVMLASALAPKLRPSARPFLWLAAALVILIACTARVYEGVHWPTDVIGGFLLALGWCAFVLWLPERWLPTPSRSWLSRAGKRRVAT